MRSGASGRWSLALVLLILAVSPAVAEAPGAEEAPGADPAESPLEPAPEDRIDWGSLELLGDLRLRGDSMRDLPGGREFDRARAALRAGARWLPRPDLELGLVGKISLASDGNEVIRANFDNERRDDLALDQAYLLWLPSSDGELLAGKAELPFELTPMVWDPDLRPIGLAYGHDFAVRGFDVVRVTGGYFAGDHLFGDESRIAAAQIAWRIREGARREGEVLLAWLAFDDLDRLPREGLGRTNRIAAGRLASDFRLVDLQVAARLDLDGRPLEARLDALRNLGADDERDALRAWIAFGDAENRPGLEVAAAFQRVQSDAVVAAFNSDDWWFPTWMRGFSASFGWGFREGLWLEVAGFRERRDDLEEDVERLLVDLRWRF